MTADQEIISKPSYQGLCLVSLPIGNNKDLSPRAREALEHADIIAAEDTRIFKIFIKENRIKVRQVFSYHDHNEESSSKELIKLLKQGKRIALVTDAGTPNISDPGFQLTKLCIQENIKITACPGPSALTMALSLSPIGGSSHYFGGFLPTKEKARLTELHRLKNIAHRLVFFEAPHRLIALLNNAYTSFGNCECVILRELSKSYEEILYLQLNDAIKHFEQTSPKGEFVVIFGKAETQAYSTEELSNKVLELLKKGLSKSDILKEVLQKSGLKKKQLYDFILKLGE